MIIVPTEKRFDWKHAPIVLFFIVITNILVFLLYQSGDTKKYEEAIELYNKYELVKKEWPFFKEYLVSREEGELLQEYEYLYKDELYEELGLEFLFKDGFYDYLLENKKDQLNLIGKRNWQEDRKEIDDLIQSTSAAALGVVPNNLEPITLITHQFLHGGLMHLVGNLFFLVICGFAVEAAIGHLRFFLFYLLSGIAGGVFHMLFDMNSSVSLIGASGAISGVMAMYLGVFRLKKIEFFYWLFIFVGYFRAPALLILPFYLGKEIYSYVSEPNSNVAFMAHAGGIIAGSLLMLISTFLDPKARNQEYIDEDQDYNPYREKLAKVYACIESCRFESAYTVLGELVKEQGLIFELAIIRYNLLKLKKGNEYKQSIIELLNINNLMPHELAKIESVWSENPGIVQIMEDESLAQLGMKLTALPNIDTSEKIFAQAYKKNNQNTSLGLLANKLSILHGNLGNENKQQEYAQLAQKLTVRTV